MTKAERLGPWQQLSKALKAVSWPPVAQCQSTWFKEQLEKS